MGDAREATQEELQRAVLHGKLAAVSKPPPPSRGRQKAILGVLGVELPGEGEAREREIEEILEDVRRRLGRDIPVE